jgi:hypothetical protein
VPRSRDMAIFVSMTDRQTDLLCMRTRGVVINVGWSNFNIAKAHRPHDDYTYMYLGIQFSLRLCPDWIHRILDKARAVHSGRYDL